MCKWVRMRQCIGVWVQSIILLACYSRFFFSAKDSEVARTQFVRCRKTISTRSKIIIESSLCAKVYLLPSYNKTSVSVRGTNSLPLVFLTIRAKIDTHSFSHTPTNLNGPTTLKPDSPNPPTAPFSSVNVLFDLPRKSFALYATKTTHNKTILFRSCFSLVLSVFDLIVHFCNPLLVLLALAYSLHQIYATQNYSWFSKRPRKNEKKKLILRAILLLFPIHLSVSLTHSLTNIPIKWSLAHVTILNGCVCFSLNMLSTEVEQRVQKKIEKVQKCFSNYSDIVHLASAGVALMALLWKED